jgi:hypothetical protein
MGSKPSNLVCNMSLALPDTGMLYLKFVKVIVKLYSSRHPVFTLINKAIYKPSIITHIIVFFLNFKFTYFLFFKLIL